MHLSRPCVALCLCSFMSSSVSLTMQKQTICKVLLRKDCQQCQGTKCHHQTSSDHAGPSQALTAWLDSCHVHVCMPDGGPLQPEIIATVHT